MKREFETIIEKRGKWYVGYVPEVPGANTQGRTLKEVSEILEEALVLVLEAHKELGQPAKVYKRSPTPTATPHPISRSSG